LLFMRFSRRYFLSWYDTRARNRFNLSIACLASSKRSCSNFRFSSSVISVSLFKSPPMLFKISALCNSSSVSGLKFFASSSTVGKRKLHLVRGNLSFSANRLLCTRCCQSSTLFVKRLLILTAAFPSKTGKAISEIWRPGSVRTVDCKFFSLFEEFIISAAN
ncbi:hypothetical protein T06_16760, partial [Trichinella sp. T6]